jgi:MYXO-CTERM domain-containing protein
LLVLTDVNGDGSNGTWTIANASAVPGGGVAVLLAAGVVRRRRR